MNKKRKRIPLDAVMAFVLMVIVLILAVEGVAVQKLPKGALGFPGFVFSVIFIVGCLELYRIWKMQKQEGQERQIKQKDIFYNQKNFMFICGLVFGYLAAMCLAGFVLSTIVFAGAFALVFHYKHPLIFGAVSVIAAIGIYYIFKNVMYIHLPGGLLFDMLV